MSTPINVPLLRLVFGLTQRAFAEIRDDQMRIQPAPGINPPVWLLGHMCFGWDAVLRMIGQRSICPAEYVRHFGPGSKLEAMPSELPAKTEMIDCYRAIGETLIAELPKVSEDFWAKPNPRKFLSVELPTMVDLASHLLFAHHMMHVGQLTVWRRLMGMPSLIEI